MGCVQDELALATCRTGTKIAIVRDGAGRGFSVGGAPKQRECFLQLSECLSSIRWSWKDYLLIDEIIDSSRAAGRPPRSPPPGLLLRRPAERHERPIQVVGLHRLARAQHQGDVPPRRLADRQRLIGLATCHEHLPERATAAELEEEE